MLHLPHADGEERVGMKLSHVVEGLLPDHQYAFCVRPINAVAMGPRGVFTDPVRYVPGNTCMSTRLHQHPVP